MYLQAGDLNNENRRPFEKSQLIQGNFDLIEDLIKQKQYYDKTLSRTPYNSTIHGGGNTMQGKYQGVSTSHIRAQMHKAATGVAQQFAI